MHPDKIHPDGTVRVVIVPDHMRGWLVCRQGNYIEVHLYLGRKDDIYAMLAKVTAEAVKFCSE